jgi:hypothetical protein
MHRTHFQAIENNLLSSLLTCTILAGPPGCGKSTAMLAEIATMPGCYILAAPRIELVEEHAAFLRSLVAGSALVVEVIHSGQSKRGVDRRLREALARTEDDHVVIVTTHEGLMGLTRDDFEGWHIRIDELPESAIVSGVLGLGVSWPALDRRYELRLGSEPGWSRIVPREDADALTMSQILTDDGKHLRKPLSLARSRGRAVEVNLGAWVDAEVPGKVMRWRSIWSFAHLSGCASLKVAAAGYSGSIIGHATAHAGGVSVEIMRVGSPRTGQPHIVIHYYTLHTGSTAWWNEHEGSRCIAVIGRHLQSVGFRGYWSCNASAEPYLRHSVGGTKISPRAAGTNAMRDYTTCAIFYSSKATSADEAVMAALDLDRIAIRTAREDEDLYQFATRGAIRDPAYGGSYAIHVYDVAQAERLQARLGIGGYEDVVIEPVASAGLMDVVRPIPACQKADPAAPVETADERKARKRAADTERKRRKRAADRTEKIASGIPLRGRGRPRRAA